MDAQLTGQCGSVTDGDREAVASFPASRATLNIAEIQLCVLLPQCRDQRIPAATTLTTALQALQEQRPVSPSQFMWCFSLAAARVKLHLFYPPFLPRRSTTVLTS